MNNRVYGARFGADFEKNKEINSQENSTPHRLTIYNDAHIMNVDNGEYKGKKNFRFVVGSTGKVENLERSLYAYSSNGEQILSVIGEDLEWNRLMNRDTSAVVFDARDRALYLVKSGNGPDIFTDSRGNFSSTQFENSLAIESNLVYKVNYIDRTLVEWVTL